MKAAMHGTAHEEEEKKGPSVPVQISPPAQLNPLMMSRAEYRAALANGAIVEEADDAQIKDDSQSPVKAGHEEEPGYSMKASVRKRQANAALAKKMQDI